MTKNRQFHFYQQTKNCQLTDDRILLTEKTFHFNLLRHHYSRSFTHVPDDACRLLSSERRQECFEGKEGSGYCYGPIEFYMPKYISPCRAVRVHLFPLRSGGNSFFQLYFSQ